MLLLLCLVAAVSATSPIRYGARPVAGPATFSRPVAPARIPRPAAISTPQNLPIVGPSGSQDCITKPGPWSLCSATCGGGIRKRSLVILQQPSGYGSKCPALHEESENCNSHPCPIDCEVEPGVYSECSATCGVGEGYRTKVDVIVREAKYGGLACPSPDALRTTAPCQQLPPCPVPVHCEVSYTPYSECSALCGVGVKSRHAFVVRQAENGGAPCPVDLSSLSETITCNEQPCPEVYDCLYLQGQWGQCSAQCGQGYRKRQIYIIGQPSPGGSPCPSQLYQQEPCNAGPCQDQVDCEVSWSHWSYCSATCGGGTQSLTGQIVRSAQNGGVPCPLPNQLHVTRTCGDVPCGSLVSRDCEVVYGPFSQCSAQCGGGYRYQKGWIKTEANGGAPCPAPSQLQKRESCNTFPCPQKIDCEVQRSYWSECSASCGGGTQARSAQILQQAQNGGLPCPTALYETRTCNNEPCF